MNCLAKITCRIDYDLPHQTFQFFCDRCEREIEINEYASKYFPHSLEAFAQFRLASIANDLLMSAAGDPSGLDELTMEVGDLV